MARYLYSEIASTVQARKNCQSNNTEWFEKHTERIEELVSDYLPYGSGYDNGTSIDLESSHANKLVLNTSFHHMNEDGMYDGWTDHTVTVTPALHGAFDLRISGRNRNDIKEMMYQDFDYALRRNVELFPDPFADVPDYERCANCRGTASVTASDGKRYCEGCAKHAEAKI